MRVFLLPLFSSALLLSACVVGTAAQGPTPPQVKGDVPAIGRKLDVVLTADGARVQLAGVPGRVTVICAYEDASALQPCGEALERFGDRVSVAGVSLADEAPRADEAFRVFHDPGGKVLAKKLDLGSGPHVLVLDRQGRVRAVLAPDDRDGLLRWVGDLAG